MPRVKSYNEEVVLEKAVDLFWKNGYANTSVRDLEKEMGINQFSIYSSFGNKRGLFLRALATYRKQVKKIFMGDLMRSDGHIEDIRAFLDNFVDSVRDGRTPNGCLIANTAMDMGSKDEEIKVQLTLFFNVLKEVFTDVLEKAKTNKELDQKADVNKLANFFLGITEGLAITAKVLEQEQLDDLIEVSMSSLR